MVEAGWAGVAKAEVGWAGARKAEAGWEMCWVAAAATPAS
jgi:hypothetical protein